jgi:hypothetical protein
MMRAVNQPVAWWGYHWEPPEPLSIIEIIERGSMSPRLAALFWLGLERGASVLVAADPPTAGKTATLTALLAFAPRESRGYFTRGLGETFDLPPLDGSNPTYILVNEMTDHLAVYTWGQYARRTFELVAQGYSLATTTHAETVAGVLDILERDLRIPRRQIAHLTFVGTIHIGYGNGRVLRRMSEVAFIQPDGDSGEDIHLSTIASWDQHDDSFRVLESPAQVSALAAWAGMPAAAFLYELGRREEYLRNLLRDGIREPRAVQEAVFSYRQEITPEGPPPHPASGRSPGRPARHRPPSARRR